MNEDIEALLGKNLFDPPETFLDEVMLRIEFLPLPARQTRRLEWIALAGGTIAGLAQLFAFLFGIWAATAAG